MNKTEFVMLKWFNLLVCFWIPLAGICQLKDLPPYQFDNHIFVTSPDSLPHVMLNEIAVFPRTKNMSKKELRQYTILEFRVKKVYPIAKVAAVKLQEYNRVYLSFNKEKERKEYIKRIEKELFSEFETEIRTMSIQQGRILIKLIDRETGRSSYEIIKEFKGGFSAFFWQGVARLFGHNLKSEYDAAVEDRQIEYIVWQIDNGLI